MSTKEAAREINYVTLHDAARVKQEAVVLEDFIKEVLDKLGTPTRSEVDALAKKIDELSAKK